MGPLVLRRAGAPVALPPSRKTRALLAYLALLDRPERRERLCELLWDVPDDPRGALRWSLSKLRPLLDGASEPRLLADRDAVELRLGDDAVDFRRLRALVQSGLAQASSEDLEAALGAGDLLDGLDLARCERFEAWLLGRRADARRWRSAALKELTGRPLDPERRLSHARAWTDVDGDDPQAWARLIELLEAAGQAREAEAQRSLAERRLSETGGALPKPSEPRRARPQAPSAQIRFCTAPDGVSIAYTVQGDGFPLVKTANWMTHLERDAEGPIWRHWIEEFTQGRAFVRYDQRGNGLSDWKAPFSNEAFLGDLESVVDAAGLQRFDLLGISQGASAAIAYAARHPERVRRIILLGAFSRGWSHVASETRREQAEAMLTLARTGWDQDTPAFRQMYTSLFIPDAGPEAQEWFNTTQRLSTNGENAHAIQRCGAQVDVDDLVAKVAAPTLVAHRRGDAVVPFEAGRDLARRLPGAQFLPLEGRNHLLLADEPAWRRFVEAARAFLAD